jgi:hypothetical protein
LAVQLPQRSTELVSIDYSFYSRNHHAEKQIFYNRLIRISLLAAGDNYQDIIGYYRKMLRY